MNNAQMIDKFKTLNRERITRLGSLLPAKNRGFIELLPLLFQVNSDALPAYINLETPAGIADYQPSQIAIDAATQHDRNFSYRRSALHHYPLRGLYLINKDGLYHYNANEVFEIWLIYSSTLSEAQCTLLSQKAAAITIWAKSQKITVEIRLFNEGSLDTISATNLDLFYCCGLVLAGSLPSWWSEKDAISQEKSLRYTQDLTAFGSVSSPSPHAIFELAVAQINKVMERGLIACLNLIFITYLLENHLNFTPLSDHLKRAMVDGETDPMLLDINTLKLQCLTSTLSDHATLSLAQKSVYLQCKEPLSKNIKQNNYPWRRTFIEDKVDTWQWSKDTIEDLDQRAQLNYRQSLTSFQLVRDQLSRSLANLALFSKQHSLNSSQIQRQLQLKFDTLFISPADTIHRLPTVFLPQQAEEHLYLSRSNQTHDWSINDKPSTLSKTPLYQHSSLLNVLSWAVSNRLLSSVTRLKVADETYTAKTNIILELVQYLLRSQLNSIPAIAELEEITAIASIKQVLLFANLENQASDSLSQHGLEMSSLQADPFNYANKKQNLVASIEGLAQSSSGQWHYFIYTGQDCLLQLLSALLLWQPTTTSLPRISCWCHYGNHGQNISNRIKNLYNHVLNHYTHNSENGEFIVSLADRLYQLRWQQQLCDISPLPKNISLLTHLNKSRDIFFKTAVDIALDKDTLFSALLNYQSTDQISLFILTEHQKITLYIIDEMGSLFKQSFNDLTEQTLTDHFHAFLTAITANDSLPSPQFFRITKQLKSGFNIAEITVAPLTSKPHYLPVIIEMDSTDESTQCTIKCGPKTFSGIANEAALFSQVRGLLLSLRKANNNYPLYITKLSFKQKNASTRDSLIQKQRLEYLLNKL